MVAALTQIYKETHVYETDTSAEWTVLPTPNKPAPSASRQTSQPAPSAHCPTEQSVPPSSQPASAKTDTAGQHTNLPSAVVKKSIPHTVTQASLESSSQELTTQSSVSSTASNTHQKTSAAAADNRRIARVTPMSHTLTVC